MKEQKMSVEQVRAMIEKMHDEAELSLLVADVIKSGYNPDEMDEGQLPSTGVGGSV